MSKGQMVPFYVATDPPRPHRSQEIAADDDDDDDDGGAERRLGAKN